MGKVECFTLSGLDLFFNSSDHRPPHFHVESADWEIRVFIDSSSKENGLHFEYKQPKNPPKKFRGLTKQQRDKLLKLLVNNRAELLREWEQKVDLKEVI